MRRVWAVRKAQIALLIMKTFWRRTWAANHIQVCCRAVVGLLCFALFLLPQAVRSMCSHGARGMTYEWIGVRPTEVLPWSYGCMAVEDVLEGHESCRK